MFYWWGLNLELEATWPRSKMEAIKLFPWHPVGVKVVNKRDSFLPGEILIEYETLSPKPLGKVHKILIFVTLISYRNSRWEGDQVPNTHTHLSGFGAKLLRALQDVSEAH